MEVILKNVDLLLAAVHVCIKRYASFKYVSLTRIGNKLQIVGCDAFLAISGEADAELIDWDEGAQLVFNFENQFDCKQVYKELKRFSKEYQGLQGFYFVRIYRDEFDCIRLSIHISERDEHVFLVQAVGKGPNDFAEKFNKVPADESSNCLSLSDSDIILISRICKLFAVLGPWHLETKGWGKMFKLESSRMYCSMPVSIYAMGQRD